MSFRRFRLPKSWEELLAIVVVTMLILLIAAILYFCGIDVFKSRSSSSIYIIISGCAICIIELIVKGLVNRKKGKNSDTDGAKKRKKRRKKK